MKKPMKAKGIIVTHQAASDGMNQKQAVTRATPIMHTREVWWALLLKMWSVAQPQKSIPRLPPMSSNTTITVVALARLIPFASESRVGPQSRQAKVPIPICVTGIVNIVRRRDVRDHNAITKVKRNADLRIDVVRDLYHFTHFGKRTRRNIVFIRNDPRREPDRPVGDDPERERRGRRDAVAQLCAERNVARSDATKADFSTMAPSDELHRTFAGSLPRNHRIRVCIRLHVNLEVGVPTDDNAARVVHAIPHFAVHRHLLRRRADRLGNRLHYRKAAYAGLLRASLWRPAYLYLRSFKPVALACRIEEQGYASSSFFTLF